MEKRKNHHRQSIRLQGYDYSQAGAYFITIDINDRLCLLGEINNGIMIENHAGRMVGKWWNKLPERYGDVTIDESVVMPNHFHGILIIKSAAVGAIPCNRPMVPCNRPVKKSNTMLRVKHATGNENNEHKSGGENMVSPLRGLGRYVSWFKRMTTNEYIHGVHQNGWSHFYNKLWQRNCHDRIIRNDMELHRIREYIRNNPVQWGINKSP
ncbi:hypothetical protein K8S19_07040 [bacterium]|nr:hypothetical protein [bacterium]